MKCLVPMALLAATVTAHADFFNYLQWERLPVERRSAYIAGSLDALVRSGVDDEGRPVLQHFGGCMNRSQMSTVELADNVRAFVNVRPALKTGSMPDALFLYLLELCNELPR
jgi:hypothetical protein